ncbi:uncharacterized protein [Equus asinus]|uniref:uncharacterized protein n=1 Tax=Equus asinus TaxID=9793 RepID=UPI0038F8046A
MSPPAAATSAASPGPAAGRPPGLRTAQRGAALDGQRDGGTSIQLLVSGCPQQSPTPAAARPLPACLASLDPERAPSVRLTVEIQAAFLGRAAEFSWDPTWFCEGWSQIYSSDGPPRGGDRQNCAKTEGTSSGGNTLPVCKRSCFPSEVENGSLVTNMASGHWPRGGSDTHLLEVDTEAQWVTEAQRGEATCPRPLSRFPGDLAQMGERPGPAGGRALLAEETSEERRILLPGHLCPRGEISLLRDAVSRQPAVFRGLLPLIWWEGQKEE